MTAPARNRARATAPELPPLSVLAAWQRRGSAIPDQLTAAAGWDALASRAGLPALAAACISRADAIVLSNIEVLQAVLDEEDRQDAERAAFALTAHRGRPVSPWKVAHR